MPANAGTHDFQRHGPSAPWVLTRNLRHFRLCDVPMRAQYDTQPSMDR